MLMNKRLAGYLIVLTTLALTACASPPKPLPNVPAILQGMNETQAAQLLQQLLPPRNLYGHPSRGFVSGHIGLGMCRASQIALDEQKGPEVRVTPLEISFNAVRTGVVKQTPQGRMSSLGGATSTDQYEWVSYREHVPFATITSVSVTEPRLLRSVCGRQKGQSEVLMRDTASHWYAALIPTAEKERFVAAIMRLRPAAQLVTEAPDD